MGVLHASSPTLRESGEPVPPPEATVDEADPRGRDGPVTPSPVSDAGEAAAAATAGDGRRGEVQGHGNRGGAGAAVGLSNGLRRAGRPPTPRVRGASEGRPGARRRRRSARVPAPPRVCHSPPIPIARPIHA
jgi:hypothetical protein